MKLPPAVASSSQKVQAAFLAFAADPTRQVKDIAAEAGLTADHVSKMRRIQGWDGLVTAENARRLESLEDLQAEMAQEAQAARRRLLRVNPAVQRVLEFKLEEMAEFDPETGEVTGLKEVVVGRRRNGEPVYGLPTMKEVQGLVAAYRLAWQHTSSLTGIDRAERLELAAGRAESVPPVVLTFSSAEPPTIVRDVTPPPRPALH